MDAIRPLQSRRYSVRGRSHVATMIPSDERPLLLTDHVFQPKLLSLAPNVLNRPRPTQMLRSAFDRIPIAQGRCEVLKIHFGPREAVVDVGHGLRPLKAIATEQPTHPLSSQGAHIRLPCLDCLSS